MNPDNTYTTLPIGMCILLNLPPNKTECSQLEDHTNCITCPIVGRFITGEEMDEDGLGHFICRFIAALTVFIGIFAIFTSSFIIFILKKQNTKQSFEILLMALAIFDLLASVGSVVTAISMILFIENWSQNYATLLTFVVGIDLYLFAKSGSSFTTVAIAAERYTAIAYPFQKMKWFTPTRTYFVAGLVWILPCVIGLPRLAGVYLSKNTIGAGIKSVENMEYLMYGTSIGKYFYFDLKNIHDQIDFWLPLILLLGLTGMTHRQMKQLSLRRSSVLNVNQRNELNTGKIFIPVVIVFFLSNIVVIITGSNIFLYETVYREGILGGLLSAAINSAANLPIYFFKSSNFKKEAMNAVKSCFKKFDSKNPLSYLEVVESIDIVGETSETNVTTE